jgi:FkbM family methyltransferase
MGANPGRNDPCTCGSGRKFKHCCMNVKSAPTAASVAAVPVRTTAVPAWYSQAMSQLAAGQARAASLLCEPNYRRDPSQNECRAFADQLLAAVRKDCDAFSSAPSSATADRLRHTRLQIAAALATLEPGSLPGSWGLFGRAHASLMDCGVRDLTRTPDEDKVLERLKAYLASGPALAATAEPLLAAMLLARNFELPIVCDLEQIPAWLRPIYLTMLLESPQVFNQIAEAERYVSFLEQTTELVHQRWVRTPDAGANPVSREVVELYVAHANLTQAYFSARNLRPLYQKRGEIISSFLTSRGIPTLSGFAPEPADERRKIRLGIFAHRFTPCTETYFTLSHFEHLDRERFDVTLYSLASSDHPLEQYCVSRADRMVVLHPTELASQIQRIRDDRLDILLLSTNMTTHTITSTLLGSVRLARIQVASVSSPVTTGTLHTDVLLSAAWNEPEADAQLHYTEHLELLPGSINYYAYHHDHDPVTIDINRERLGIPADAMVFFSGANFFKILPELSEAWARILAAVPGSILLLMPFNPNWGRNYQRLPFFIRIQQQLSAHGVSADRLRVIDTVPTRADVHRVIGLADVYLDAYPFAGACSMLDSILVGVPAVVRGGGVGRSNHGVALLRMVGLEELSCGSESQYIDRSIALARNPADRQRIRGHLQQLAQAAVPVYYDTPLFASRVGAAFERLYRQYQNRYALPAGDGVALRRSVEEVARRVVGRHVELNELTDIGTVRLLIEPYFQSQQSERPRLMLDVGACHGAMAQPLLARGWHAELLEPDPAARQVLERNLSAYSAQIRIHAFAAGSQSAGSVAFHQAAIQGLSGLSDSPFGATANVLQVPCVRLEDFCAQRGITALDFLKIDAEGYDFDVLESLDFERVKPELIMIEYGTHFARQTLDVINRGVADMASRGYGAVVFAYADDGNFKRSVWQYRLTGVYVDRAVPAQEGAAFGNILFYRAADPRLLLVLQGLLDSCDQGRGMWTSECPGTFWPPYNSESRTTSRHSSSGPVGTRPDA